MGVTLFASAQIGVDHHPYSESQSFIAIFYETEPRFDDQDNDETSFKIMPRALNESRYFLRVTRH